MPRPAYMASADDVKDLSQAATFTPADIDRVFAGVLRMRDRPLGGLHRLTMDDLSYVRHHALQLQAMCVSWALLFCVDLLDCCRLKHAAELNCGLLIHFW